MASMILRCTFIHFLINSLLLASLLLSSTSFADELPSIGEPADLALSPQEEKKLGSRFFRTLQQQGSILKDPELSSYIQSLGNRLNSGIGQEPFRFFIIKDARINAFAVPGGFIGMNAGLILASRNEGELAGVMAHEIAHVTQRHIARFYAGSGTASWSQLGAFLAAIALASQGEGDAAAAAFYAGSAASYQSLINHTRIHEQEADRVGIQYLAQAGFNPGDMAGFFDVIRNKSLEADKRFEILRTHPLSENRIAEAKSRAQQIGIHPVPSSKRYLLMKARLIATLEQQRGLLKHLQNTQQTLSEVDRYAFALLLIDNRDYTAAHSQTEKLLKRDPDNIHYRLLAAQLSIAEQNYIQAEQQLTRLLKLYPEHIASIVYYSRTLRLLKKHKENVQLIKGVAEQNRPIELYRLLAESLNHLNEQAQSQLAQGQYHFLSGSYRAARLQLSAALKQKDKLTEKDKKQAKDLLELIEEEQKQR